MIIEKLNFELLDIDPNWTLNEYTRKETGKWSHSYHRYPAKFIPQLVEKLFDEYIDKSIDPQKIVINDPFMGSGTTIVSAISRGYNAIGTDINKTAHLITKVKATPIDPEYLESKINDFINKIEFLNPKSIFYGTKTNVEPYIPEKHVERIDYWFSDENKIKLGFILSLILQEDDEKIRNFLKVAFSQILKNCSIWLQSSNKPTRDLKKNPSEPYSALTRHLRLMVRGNKELYSNVPNHVIHNIDKYLNIKAGNASEQPTTDDSVDLIVTSSPYVTSYEYADLHQLSTIWFEHTDDLREYKRQFIGSSLRREEVLNVNSELAIQLFKELEIKSTSLAQEVIKFFSDMEKSIAESYRVLKNGGRACYVIGNTSLKGVKIKNAEIFAELMENIGFTIDNVIKREIPTKGLPQNRDSKTGQFAKLENADKQAYPVEYILIAKK